MKSDGRKGVNLKERRRRRERRKRERRAVQNGRIGVRREGRRKKGKKIGRGQRRKGGGRREEDRNRVKMKVMVGGMLGAAAMGVRGVIAVAVMAVVTVVIGWSMGRDGGRSERGHDRRRRGNKKGRSRSRMWGNGVKRTGMEGVRDAMRNAERWRKWKKRWKKIRKRRRKERSKEVKRRKREMEEIVRGGWGEGAKAEEKTEGRRRKGGTGGVRSNSGRWRRGGMRGGAVIVLIGVCLLMKARADGGEDQGKEEGIWSGTISAVTAMAVKALGDRARRWYGEDELRRVMREGRNIQEEERCYEKEGEGEEARRTTWDERYATRKGGEAEEIEKGRGEGEGKMEWEGDAFEAGSRPEVGWTRMSFINVRRFKSDRIKGKSEERRMWGEMEARGVDLCGISDAGLECMPGRLGHLHKKSKAGRVMEVARDEWAGEGMGWLVAEGLEGAKGGMKRVGGTAMVVHERWRHRGDAVLQDEWGRWGELR